MGREEELLEKIDEWQQKANRESDPFNEYVSIFIAFNIFYNLLAWKKNPKVDFARGDSTRATKTISLVETNELFQSIKPNLKEYVEVIPVFSEEYWPTQKSLKKVPISETLKVSLRTKDKWKTIDMLIKWLYKVRCNLVHGVKSYRDTDQRKLLEMSTRLLDAILTHLVSRYKQTYRIRRD